MKQFFVTLIILCSACISFAKTIDGGVFYSNANTITYDFDKSDYLREWSIRPEIRPDFLRIYCEKEVLVTFHIEKTSVPFKLSEKDTIEIIFIVNKTDSAYTKLIGVKEIPNTISEDEKLFHLSRLWSEAKYNFVNIDQIDFNWDSLYYEYIPLIKRTSNDYEYFQSLQRFFASLHDGHTEVMLPYPLFVYQDYIPISIDVFDKQLLITSIRKGIGLDSTFLSARIMKIDDIPIDTYLRDSIIPYISASTEQSLWMQIPEKICFGPRCHPFRAEVLKSDGELVPIVLQKNGEATRKQTGDYFSVSPNKERNWDLIQLNWLQDSILHLSINAFYPEDYVQSLIDDAEDEILKAKRLIIDLRANGGGSTTVAHYVQSRLTQDSFFINYAWQSRINDGVRRANGNWIKEYEDYCLGTAYRTEEGDTVFVADSIRRWNMPTVILIGEYTFSAAEDLLVNLYETGDRPLLIGSETGGSTGSPLVVEDLPYNGYARLCTRRILYPYSHTPFVNKGITPDILVPKTYEMFCTGKDEVLNKAIEIVSKIKKNKINE